mgnify:CR=1 FL=1
MFRTRFLVLLAGSFSGLLRADETTATRQQIEAAREDIAGLQQLLQQIRQEKNTLQSRLRTTESQIGDLEKQIDQLQQGIRNNESELRQLNQKKNRLEGALSSQQALVAGEARALYQNGQREYLKLLLNQQNPETFSRTLTYYDYLGKARFARIAAFTGTLHELDAVRQQTGQRQQQLQARQKTLENSRQALVRVRQERQQALASLEHSESGQKARLQARQSEQAQLERVLKTIEETLARQAREAEQARQKALAEARRREQQAREERERLARLEQERARVARASSPPPPVAPVVGISRPAPPPPGPARPAVVQRPAEPGSGPFFQARGYLAWPVSGPLLARYGSPRGEDVRSTWDGVLIGAAAGAQVRAIHGGRVVFADWLRGAGLLLIVDHGNGYLSLYGHNQSLLRAPGDIVRAGEPIATVGNSGGQEQAALYFAIRHNGRPSDPAQWCRTQG